MTDYEKGNVTDIELKPCPFCGAPARLQDYRYPPYSVPYSEHAGASAECPSCFAYFYGETTEIAAEKWNRRSP
jgi:hypothetical protein